jgi:nucleotide-binding universal stress UspA family protein
LSAVPFKILLAVDDSEYTKHVAEVASRFFSVREVVIYMLSVVETPRGPATEPGLDVEIEQEEKKRFRSLHDTLAATHFTSPRQKLESLVVEGVPADVICAKAVELGVQVIMMGSRGRGKLQSVLMGSVSEDVVHKSRVPVLVVPKLQDSPRDAA